MCYNGHNSKGLTERNILKEIKNMKKHLIIIAMLGIIASLTGCGVTENDGTSETPSAAVTVTTTAEAASEAATTTAEKKEAAATTVTEAETKAAEKTETAAGGAGASAPVISQETYLFGGSVATKSDDLNMRDKPDTNGNVIASIPNGTQIDVYSCSTNGWYVTSYNGKTGYVSADFVKKIEDYDPMAYNADIRNLVGQWTYQVAAGNFTVDVSANDNGTITVKDDSTYTYTDPDGNTHSGTVELKYEEYSNGDKVPYFAFYEGSEFFIGCYCGQNSSDVYYVGNGGMARIVRK